jgi:predicted RNase H-like nuclease
VGPLSRMPSLPLEQCTCHCWRMSEAAKDLWLAGVDGCPGGWIAAFVRPTGDDCVVAVYPNFAHMLVAPQMPDIVAVDIPIGLPERAGHGGRAAENAVRLLLGQRQSSVFSVPSRTAIYASDYGAACNAALLQLFNIAPKIREVDAILCANPEFTTRVFEVHPELAFWRLNGERPLAKAKKIRNRPYEPGLILRRELLALAGLPSALTHAPPKGAAADDLIDALACAAIARRIHAGQAQRFPDPPPLDRHGLPMAIWA